MRANICICVYSMSLHVPIKRPCPVPRMASDIVCFTSLSEGCLLTEVCGPTLPTPLKQRFSRYPDPRKENGGVRPIIPSGWEIYRLFVLTELAGRKLASPLVPSELAVKEVGPSLCSPSCLQPTAPGVGQDTNTPGNKFLTEKSAQPK